MSSVLRPVRGPLKRIVLVALVGLACGSCGPAPGTGEDAEVATRGSVEVTATLTEIRGEFVDKLDYDYAFVMKYEVPQVHRGEVDGDTIYVGHYNPQKPRAQAADARVPEVGGALKKFRAGDVHRMALEPDIDEQFMGGIINRYFGEHDGPVHWAIWTNPASKP